MNLEDKIKSHNFIKALETENNNLFFNKKRMTFREKDLICSECKLILWEDKINEYFINNIWNWKNKKEIWICGEYIIKQIIE